AAWGAIVQAYYDDVINATELDYYAALMGAPVTAEDPDTSVDEEFTMEYAKEINDKMINDADFANSIKSAWTTAAKAQYNAVLAMIQALYP
ncbi:MAG: ABC transporter substrate-binding protein, partial [Candidatus Thorarchaeota archaeon]